MLDPKETPENIFVHYDDNETIVDSNSDAVQDILSSAGAWSDIEDEFFERLEEANQESVRELWS